MQDVSKRQLAMYEPMGDTRTANGNNGTPKSRIPRSREVLEDIYRPLYISRKIYIVRRYVYNSMWVHPLSFATLFFGLFYGFALIMHLLLYPAASYLNI